MAFTVSRPIIFTAVFHIHWVTIEHQWRKSPMNHDMTVQTDAKLRNIGPVSDLGPHMEVAQFWNWKDQNPRGLCGSHCYKQRNFFFKFCLQSKGSLLMPFRTENQAFNDIKNLIFSICQMCQHKDTNSRVPYSKHQCLMISQLNSSQVISNSFQENGLLSSIWLFIGPAHYFLSSDF